MARSFKKKKEALDVNVPGGHSMYRPGGKPTAGVLVYTHSYTRGPCPTGRRPKKRYASAATRKFAPLACDDVDLSDVECAEHLAYEADAEITDDLDFESDCGKSREGADHTNAFADWVGGSDMYRVDLGTGNNGNAKDSPDSRSKGVSTILWAVQAPGESKAPNWCANGGGGKWWCLGVPWSWCLYPALF